MKKKLALVLATWFYSGLIPPLLFKGMAGTYGSLASLPLVYASLYLHEISHWLSLAIMVVIFIIGLWSVPISEHELGPKKDWKGKIKTKDQNQIVIDEVLGMLIACYLIPFNHPRFWLLIAIGLGLFRFFDIVKVPPAKFFDRLDIKGSVMLDHFIADIYTFITLQIIILFIN